jgi:intein-encoded DNA endonuclease-like protein
VLGFFAADGYLTKNKRGGCFWSIQITDLDLLNKIRDTVGSNHKIGVRFPKNNEKILYRLQIGSKEMCDDLNSLGFTTGKTYSMAVPNIPAIFLRDFVRGYFDGDGNVWIGFIHKDRLKTTLSVRVTFTSCSKSFLRDLRRRLRLHMIVNGVFSKGKGNFYRLIYSVKDSLKLYDFMYNHLIYQNSDLFLERKKIIFEKYIKMRS